MRLMRVRNSLAGVDAIEVFAGNVEKMSLSSAGCNEDSVEVLVLH